MAKTIVFKEEFEIKLKKLKIKTRFVNNLKKYDLFYRRSGKFEENHMFPKGLTLSEKVEYLNSLSCWEHFINDAFGWSMEDGSKSYNFWSTIYLDKEKYHYETN